MIRDRLNKYCEDSQLMSNHRICLFKIGFEDFIQKYFKKFNNDEEFLNEGDTLLTFLDETLLKDLINENTNEINKRFN